MIRRNHPVTLLQASQDSPTLGRLLELNRDSIARLQSIESLIPPALRGSVKAGPIDGAVWCLLLDNNAAAAKMRQLLPMLQSRLLSAGWAVESIRLKVNASASR